mgnify:CR=1 FL=1|tara:strand:- start:1297 stop:1539 length:243 start_codon:yes stop_codon:yes gene_type:complete
MQGKRFLESVVVLLEQMKLELHEKEKKCSDGRMSIRIGHRVSAIHKVKHYIKQRINDEDIPECIRHGKSTDFLYNLKSND